jgi:hypothetical protein
VVEAGRARSASTPFAPHPAFRASAKEGLLFPLSVDRARRSNAQCPAHAGAESLSDFVG